MALSELWVEESSSKRFLVQRYIMPFAYGIKEE